MTRIAILSTAHIHTKSFIENFLKATDGRVVAMVWDDNTERGEKYAAMAKAPFEKDLKKVLSNPELDGFLICSENTRHLTLLEAVLPLGKPVMCEKPLTTLGGEAAKVLEMARRAGTPVCSGYFQPFGSVMRGVRRDLDGKKWGTVTRVKFRNAHHAAYGRWFDNPDLAWFTDPKLSGGGAFLDMGTHAVHLLRHLFGPVEKVWAEIGNHSGQYPACDDFGIAHLKFKSGILGTVEAAWTQTGGFGGLEVVGSEATLYHDGKDYVVKGPKVDLAPVAPGEGQKDRVDRLIALCRKEIPEVEWKADLEAAIDAVTIMEAAYTSAKSGNWVKVG